MFETSGSSSQTDSIGLDPCQWTTDPHTGIVSLTDEALKRIINPDPLEKWYILDSEPIARGQFATVYRCQNKFSGEEFAAKFSSRWRLGADCTADLVHEIAVCALLRQTHRVIRLIDVFSTEDELVLIMEYAPGGDLQTILDEDFVPYETNVISFLRQLLEGLLYIHEKNIVHLDIKPQNLVLMGDYPNCCVKLCDFEISRLLTPGVDVREILGTADYVAPEIIHYEPITTKTDMWTFGVLTYVLLTGFLPFGGDNDQETFLEITRGELDFPEELFEDISEHAIDFIKRLLIRQPHLRMSAKECLDHPWMKSDVKKQCNVYLNNNTSSPVSSSNHSVNHQSPLYCPQMYPNFSNGNFNCPPNLNEISLETAFDILESGSSCLSPSRTPRATTPINIVPTILTPMNESPRDTRLPPLYPIVPIPRICTSTHSSTSSLNRGNSRQSLERLRSMSKSREVLVERLQSSSQKKVISKSRERLFDGRHGLNRSRERLYDQRSFSHSVETLTPFDWLSPEESNYDSYSNANMPYLLNMLPVINDGNMNNRLYKSMASIDRLNEASEKYSINSLKPSQNIYTSTSGRSINDENSSFDRLMNRYQIVLNNKKEAERKVTKDKTIEKKKKTNNKNSNLNLNDRKKHKSAPNKKYNDKSNKSRHEHDKEVSTTKNSVTKIERSTKNEPLKKKIDKAIKTQPTIKESKDCCESTKINSVNIRRRGSVSHIEQRIQERHERKIEMEKKKKSSLSSKPTSNRRRHSLNDHKSDQRRNNKSKEQKIKRQKSLPVVKTRRPSKSLSTIEGSPSSSLESVKEFNNNIKNKNNCDTIRRTTKECERVCHPSKDISSQTKTFNRRNSSKTIPREIQMKREDERTQPLLECIDGGIFSRSNSMDSNSSISSCSTIRASQPTTPTVDLLEEIPLERLSVSDKIGNGESKLKTETNKSGQTKNPEERNCKKQDTKVHTSTSDDPDLDSLTIIDEEDECQNSSRNSSHLGSPVPSYVRSLSSNSSGIGSMASEPSDSNTNLEVIKTVSKCKQHDTFSRFRSLSINSNHNHTNRGSIPLMRSHSIHLDTPLSGKARPWGEICNGSVNRAFQMFNQKSVGISIVGRKSSDPTSDRR